MHFKTVEGLIYWHFCVVYFESGVSPMIFNQSILPLVPPHFQKPSNSAPFSTEQYLRT